MGHRWCKERTKKNGGDTAEGETHRQVAMGERKEDERSGKEGARVQANHRFRAKMADKRVQNDEKGKKKIKSARKQRDEWGGGSECVSFPLSQGRPLMLCTLLLPHSLPSVPPRSRQLWSFSAPPLPSPPPSSSLSRSLTAPLRREQTNQVYAIVCGGSERACRRITTNVKNINR